MEKIVAEVSMKHKNLREEYKQLILNIKTFNDKKAKELHDRLEIENQKFEAYLEKSANSRFFKGLYWRLKSLEKKYVGKKLMVQMNELKVKSRKMSDEIKNFSK